MSEWVWPYDDPKLGTNGTIKSATVGSHGYRSTSVIHGNHSVYPLIILKHLAWELICWPRLRIRRQESRFKAKPAKEEKTDLNWNQYKHIYIYIRGENWLKLEPIYTYIYIHEYIYIYILYIYKYIQIYLYIYIHTSQQGTPYSHQSSMVNSQLTHCCQVGGDGNSNFCSGAFPWTKYTKRWRRVLIKKLNF